MYLGFILQMMENVSMSQSDNWRKFKLSILFSMITLLNYCIQHIQRLDLLPYYSCKLDQELEILTSER